MDPITAAKPKLPHSRLPHTSLKQAYKSSPRRTIQPLPTPRAYSTTHAVPQHHPHPSNSYPRIAQACPAPSASGAVRSSCSRNAARQMALCCVAYLFSCIHCSSIHEVNAAQKPTLKGVSSCAWRGDDEPRDGRADGRRWTRASRSISRKTPESPILKCRGHRCSASYVIRQCRTRTRPTVTRLPPSSSPTQQIDRSADLRQAAMNAQERDGWASPLGAGGGEAGRRDGYAHHRVRV